jgi:hypothetical protein
MKITELTGIKSTPAFRAAQTFVAGDDFINVDSRPSRSNLRSAMSAAGWEPAGDGYFAEVFINPNYDYALKIFSNSDQRYAAYFRYMKEHQDNPHVPKVRGNIVKLSPGVLAARIEKLSPIDERDQFLLKYVAPSLRRRYRSEVRPYLNPVAWILGDEQNQEFLEEKWPKLRQLYDDLWELVGEENGDFDGYQFMVRDPWGTLVWIDP